MNCPFCGSFAHAVVDKRAVMSSGEIRRRRECLKCLRRFTTYERLASLEIWVVKKDGRKETFNRDKLRTGIAKALEKRPGGIRVDELTEKIERRLKRKKSREITSRFIGQNVLGELKKIDTVAYLRFVSVYRQFEKPEDFTKELQSIT